MSESNRELTALQGPVVINGTFSRENTMRDVLQTVMNSSDVEFGVVRILSPDLRGYFGVSFGSSIVGGHTTSTKEFGLPALRQLLAANMGMFIFVKLQEFPVELRQNLNIPIKDLLEWRPEGVPPDLVPLLSQALAPYERMQAAMDRSECMDALRAGTMQVGVEAAAEEADFALYWGSGFAGTGGGGSSGGTVTAPLAALIPGSQTKQPNPLSITVDVPAVKITNPPPELDENGEPVVRHEVASSWVPKGPANIQLPPTPPRVVPQQQQQSDSGRWSTEDLDALARAQLPPTEEPDPQQSLALSGRFKLSQLGGGVSTSGDDVQPVQPIEKASGELTASGRYRPDPDLSASGRFIASEMASLLPEEMPADPRALMELQEKPKAKMHPIVLGCGAVALVLLGVIAWEIFGLMNTEAPSLVNIAADEISAEKLPQAINHLDEALAANPQNEVAQMLRAVALIESKSFKEAAAQCDATLKFNPDAIDALRMRAVAKAQLNQFDSAMKDADAYLKLAKDDPAPARAEALAVRAYCEMKLNRLAAALADYDKACELDKDNLHLFASKAIVKNMKATKK